MYLPGEFLSRFCHLYLRGNPVEILKEDQEGDVNVLSVGEYLREGYVRRAITIRYRGDDLLKVYIISDTYGTMEWESGVGMNRPHKWETEDQAEKASELSRYYTARIINGDMPHSYGIESILTDFEDLLSYALFTHLKTILLSRSWEKAGELVERIRRETSPP